MIIALPWPAAFCGCWRQGTLLYSIEMVRFRDKRAVVAEPAVDHAGDESLPPPSKEVRVEALQLRMSPSTAFALVAVVLSMMGTAFAVNRSIVNELADTKVKTTEAVAKIESIAQQSTARLERLEGRVERLQTWIEKPGSFPGTATNSATRDAPSPEGPPRGVKASVLKSGQVAPPICIDRRSHQRFDCSHAERCYKAGTFLPEFLAEAFKVAGVKSGTICDRMLAE